MRLIEFANAEEQLALWKLINDNVWSAIHAQAQEQAKQRAEQEYKKKKGPMKDPLSELVNCYYRRLTKTLKLLL